MNQATFIGVLAIVLWSVVVGLIRSITDQVGATAGAALIYSFAAVLLMIHGRGLGLRKITPRYFIIGGTLFVSY
ncbi:MAG: EamA family transporter, partial [Pseudomonadota bacterium]|nr:EamA family transporter [Pseudomonadota bacterium]